MNPDQKDQAQDKTTDAADSDLAAKKVSEVQAEQVRGGATVIRRHDDESPKESRLGRA